ncbi:tartrate dehydrogenase [Atractiella rhizophila]|nr:tartrate dehydrogenase [Atractiella rhizophila]
MSRVHRIASIPGDGIGPEVISAGIEVLEAVAAVEGFSFEWKEFDWTSENYKKRGYYIPEGGLDELRKYEAIFFGAVGARDVPDHISLWSLILPIRQTFQQYANVRPTKIFKGVTSPLANTKPGDLDWVIIRENCEGEYAGQGGRSHVGTPYEVGTELSIFTRIGIERIMRFGFELALTRPKKFVTVVTKSNAQRNGMVLWDEIAAEVGKEYEAKGCRMVASPQSLDTIIATNLHGDILSDLAAGLAGSIGIATSANLDPTRKNPSMFEPVHGAAFDIVGKNLANPVATFWCASEMLRFIGEERGADRLFAAVEEVCEKGFLTKDLGGGLGTTEVTKRIIEAVKRERRNN